MPSTEAWLAVVQTGDEPHEQETETVTLIGLRGEIGATIEVGNGTRIELTEPVGEAREAA